MKRCENCFYYNIYPNGESYGWCDARSTNTQYASICKYFDILDELVKCKNCLYWNGDYCFNNSDFINENGKCRHFKCIQKDKNNA